MLLNKENKPTNDESVAELKVCEIEYIRVVGKRLINIYLLHWQKDIKGGN